MNRTALTQPSASTVDAQLHYISRAKLQAGGINDRRGMTQPTGDSRRSDGYRIQGVLEVQSRRTNEADLIGFSREKSQDCLGVEAYSRLRLVIERTLQAAHVEHVEIDEHGDWVYEPWNAMDPAAFDTHSLARSSMPRLFGTEDYERRRRTAQVARTVPQAASTSAAGSGTAVMATKLLEGK
jgi:hypothetical protein